MHTVNTDNAANTAYSVSVTTAGTAVLTARSDPFLHWDPTWDLLILRSRRARFGPGRGPAGR